jgi:hypothetical protein
VSYEFHLRTRIHRHRRYCASGGRRSPGRSPIARACNRTDASGCDARGLALGVLAVLALIFALSWAEKFLVPLLLGIVVAYTLNPLVVWLEAIRIPRVVGTVIADARRQAPSFPPREIARWPFGRKRSSAPCSGAGCAHGRGRALGPRSTIRDNAGRPGSDDGDVTLRNPHTATSPVCRGRGAAS